MAQVSYLDGAVATRSLQKVENEYGSLMDELQKRVQEAIKQIQDGWKGQDCVEFINKNLIPAVKESANEVQKVFQSINDTVTQNARNYEKRFLKGAKVFQAVAHHPLRFLINPVGAFTGTVIGITNEAAIESAKAAMDTLQKQTEMILEKAKKAAADSGFYGGNQQQKYTASMGKIKNSIAGVAKELGTATKKVAKVAVDDSRNIAKANEQAF